MDWHRILQFASALKVKHHCSGHYAEVMAHQEKQARERWSSLAMLDLKPEFRRLAGYPDAEQSPSAGGDGHGHGHGQEHVVHAAKTDVFDVQKVVSGTLFGTRSKRNWRRRMAYVRWFEVGAMCGTAMRAVLSGLLAASKPRSFQTVHCHPSK
jgi:hypothetical protein